MMRLPCAVALAALLAAPLAPPASRLSSQARLTDYALTASDATP